MFEVYRINKLAAQVARARPLFKTPIVLLQGVGVLDHDTALRALTIIEHGQILGLTNITPGPEEYKDPIAAVNTLSIPVVLSTVTAILDAEPLPAAKFVWPLPPWQIASGALVVLLGSYFMFSKGERKP